MLDVPVGMASSHDSGNWSWSDDSDAKSWITIDSKYIREEQQQQQLHQPPVNIIGGYLINYVITTRKHYCNRLQLGGSF